MSMIGYPAKNIVAIPYNPFQGLKPILIFVGIPSILVAIPYNPFQGLKRGYFP